MDDNRVPIYRSMETSELYVGQSPCVSDKNGIFEGFSAQGDVDTAITSICDKDWIYHANGEIWGRCVLRPLTESSNNI